MRTLYAVTVFTSAFLLFMVQPMLAKLLLPKLGGAAATWIVSMLFFQVILLAGYGYAAYGNAKLSPRTQAKLHITLLVIAIACFIPLQLPELFDTRTHTPEYVILSALLLCVGLPYFTLSAHNSLLQHWYFNTFKTTPYTLFAVSNAGSLLGLLSYPFATEWLLQLSQQTVAWSIGYCLLAIMVITLVLKLPRGEHIQTIGVSALPTRTILWVILLGFIPSSLFLSTSLVITSDVTSFPLLWVIPLALYLLSFIIAFSPKQGKLVHMAKTLHPVAVVYITLSVYFMGSLGVIMCLATYFLIALSCHSTAAQLKPEPQRLGSYYLWLSFGGALGGVLGVASPHIFNDIYEFYIVAMLSLVTQFCLSRPTVKSVALVALLAVVVVLQMYYGASKGTIMHQSRSFFGIVRVVDTPKVTELKHGTITHGIQAKDPKQRLQVVAYYVPVADFIATQPKSFHDRPFAVVGLGAGILACAGTKGQTIDYFEIDKDVITMANNPDYFTYLRDCPPNVHIVEGDARITLNEQPDHRYNLLVIDAFSSDSIPVHLLTTEAVSMFTSKLDAGGVLALHISNRYLTLQHLTAAAIREAGWTPFIYDYNAPKETPLRYSAVWMFATPLGAQAQRGLIAMGASPYTADGTPPWTDNYSNLLDGLLP